MLTNSITIVSGKTPGWGKLPSPFTGRGWGWGLLITIITIITSESTGDSATASLTTANWQYSRDNVTWYDIDSTAIGNNSANTP
jgi:hypothetical protein